MEAASDQVQPKSEPAREKSTVATSVDSKVVTLVNGGKSEHEERKAVVGQKKQQLDANKLVEQWNDVYPIGTKVTSDFYDTELETRTEAILLFGHRAAVYMKGYNGYFDLREVTPVG